MDLKKLISLVSLILLTCLLLTFLLEWPQHSVEVIFCDVGQGDGVILIDGFTQWIVDGGSYSLEMLSCYQRHVPWWDRTIEGIIVSHADEDHFGGLAPILDQYVVSQIVISPYKKETPDFTHFHGLLQRKARQNTKLLRMVQGDAMNISRKITAKCIAPQVQADSELRQDKDMTETYLSDASLPALPDGSTHNDESIVLFLNIEGVDILLTGDIGVSKEQALLQMELIKDVDVLKVAHHGSKTSTSLGFVEESTPENAVISVGKNNYYGHPSPQVIKNLDTVGANIFRTDLHGEVRMKIFAGHYSIVTEH